MTVRQAGLDDIGRIHDMAEVVFRRTYRDIIPPGQMEYMMGWMYAPESLREQMETGHTYFIAEDGDVPLGYVSVQPEGPDADGVEVFHLQKIYVMPDAQGTGLGARLFRRALAHARSLAAGPARIELNVNRSNPAVGFYRHMGMKVLRQGDFPIGDGYCMNDYIMGLDLAQDVALALSSGGPRGFAYIGAIEELEHRGYRVTSVAGSSIGSLVGGIYAAGRLAAFKDWLFSLDNFQVMALMDISINRRYIVKGDRIINALKEILPDVRIEDLPVPYAAVATDLYTGEGVVFREGKLFDAIRASISIPSLFRPVRYGERTLVDGGLANTLPLDLVARNGHDILVGFNVNEVAPELPDPGRKSRDLVSILDRSFSIMNHTIARMGIAACPPDILVRMPFDAYGAIRDYGRGREIAEKGRDLMAAALDTYEASDGVA